MKEIEITQLSKLRTALCFRCITCIDCVRVLRSVYETSVADLEEGVGS